MLQEHHRNIQHQQKLPTTMKPLHRNTSYKDTAYIADTLQILLE
jgi:hypothetical protein